MSYDLCYWCVGSDDDERSPGEIYEGLCEDGEVDGLVWLSVSEIKARFQEAFPTIEDFGEESDCSLSDCQHNGAREFAGCSKRRGGHPVLRPRHK